MVAEKAEPIRAQNSNCARSELDLMNVWFREPIFRSPSGPRLKSAAVRVRVEFVLSGFAALPLAGLLLQALADALRLL